MEILIKNGANVNARYEDGKTPLHAAAYKGHKDIVEFLVAWGADVNVKTKGGTTPLQAALLPYAKELLRRYGGK